MFSRPALFASLVLSVLSTEAPRCTFAADAEKFERLPLTASDIAGVAKLDVYKFGVPIEPNAQFQVVITEQQSSDSTPKLLAEDNFTNNSAETQVEITLAFLPRDRAMRGVLLSNEEYAEYQVHARPCSPPGVATMVKVPLKDVEMTQKTLVFLTPERSESVSDENETVLLAILAKFDGKPASLESSYPRAIVAVRVLD